MGYKSGGSLVGLFAVKEISKVTKETIKFVHSALTEQLSWRWRRASRKQFDF